MKTIVFDLDNTLLFIGDSWINVYEDFINKYNLQITPHDLYNVIDDFEKENVGHKITIKDLEDFINARLNINITKDQIEDLLLMYKDIPIFYTDKLNDILSYLSKKYKLVGYSNWFKDNQVDRLKKYGLDRYFSNVYGWDTARIKPSKCQIEEITNDGNIDDYIFIGDNMDIDLKVPSDMGIKTIFLNLNGVKQDNYEEIHSLDELKEIL